MLRSLTSLARRIVAAPQIRVIWFSPRRIEAIVFARSAGGMRLVNAVCIEESMGWVGSDYSVIAGRLMECAGEGEADTVVLFSGACVDSLVIPVAEPLRGRNAAEAYFRWRMEKEVYRPASTTAVCWERVAGEMPAYLCTAVATETLSGALSVCEKTGWSVDMAMALPQLYGPSIALPGQTAGLSLIVEPGHMLAFYSHAAGKSFLRVYAFKEEGMPSVVAQVLADWKASVETSSAIRVCGSGALAEAVVALLRGVGEHVDVIDTGCGVEDNRDLVAHACRAACFLTGQV